MQASVLQDFSPVIRPYFTEVSEQELSLAKSHSANVNFGGQRLELRQELER